MRTSRPRHKWLAEDRKFLCLLKRLNTRQAVKQIFDILRSNRLRDEGFLNGIPATTLDAQIQEIKNGGPGYNDFKIIQGLSLNALQTVYSKELDTIKIAGESRVSATRGAHNVLSCSTARSIRRRNAGSRAKVSKPPCTATDAIECRNSNHCYSMLHQFVYDENDAAKERQLEQVLSESGDIPGSSLDLYAELVSSQTSSANVQPKAKAHPPLLFRAVKEVSHYRTRKFQGSLSPIPPPPISTGKEFKDALWPHLQRCRKYPSPFISLAQNPKNAIRRIELGRSEDCEQKYFLAIFDFEEVQADATVRYGTDCGPFLVRSFFTKYGVSDLPDGYKGTGEWVAYGSIECEPVAVLDSAQVIGIARVLRKYKMNRDSDLSFLRDSLRLIPSEWLGFIVHRLMIAYVGRTIPQFGSNAFEKLMCSIFGLPLTLSIREVAARTHQTQASLDDDNESDSVTSSQRSAYKIPMVGTATNEHDISQGEIVWDVSDDSTNSEWIRLHSPTVEKIKSTRLPLSHDRDASILPSIEGEDADALDLLASQLVDNNSFAKSITPAMSETSTKLSPTFHTLQIMPKDNTSAETIGVEPLIWRTVNSHHRGIQVLATPAPTAKKRPLIQSVDSDDKDLVIVGVAKRARNDLDLRSLSIQDR